MIGLSLAGGWKRSMSVAAVSLKLCTLIASYQVNVNISHRARGLSGRELFI
jgi:hypothetical protein